MSFAGNEIADAHKVQGGIGEAELAAGGGAIAGVEESRIDAIGDGDGAGRVDTQRDGELAEALGDGDDAAGAAEGPGEEPAEGAAFGVHGFIAAEGDGEGAAEEGGQEGGGDAVGVAEVGVEDIEVVLEGGGDGGEGQQEGG